MRPAVGPRFSGAGVALIPDELAQPPRDTAPAAAANSRLRRLTPPGADPDPSHAAQCLERIKRSDPDCSMDVSVLFIGEAPAL